MFYCRYSAHTCTKILTWNFISATRHPHILPFSMVASLHCKEKIVHSDDYDDDDKNPTLSTVLICTSDRQDKCLNTLKPDLSGYQPSSSSSHHHRRHKNIFSNLLQAPTWHHCWWQCWHCCFVTAQSLLVQLYNFFSQVGRPITACEPVPCRLLLTLFVTCETQDIHLLNQLKMRAQSNILFLSWRVHWVRHTGAAVSGENMCETLYMINCRLALASSFLPVKKAHLQSHALLS